MSEADEEERALGNLAFKRGDMREAIARYTRCSPSDSSALSNLSLCLLKVGDVQEALDAATRCTLLRPDWAKAWGRKAAALRAGGDYSGALDAVERGLEEEPGNKDLAKERADLFNVVVGKEGEAPILPVGNPLGPRGVMNLSGAYTLQEGGRNLLVLLHGLGDSDANFVELGRRMALPDTALLALRAPLTLPLGLGHAWVPSFEDDGEPIGAKLGEQRRIAGLQRASLGVVDALRACWRAGYEQKKTFLLGFSQGGVVAFDAGRRAGVGGVVAISGCLLPEAGDAVLTSTVPVLVTHGTRDPAVPIAAARRCFARIAGGRARWKEYPKGHQTPCSEEEVRDLMDFLAPLMAPRSPLPHDPDVVVSFQSSPIALARPCPRLRDL